jgi:hypothetical protein
MHEKTPSSTAERRQFLDMTTVEVGRSPPVALYLDRVSGQGVRMRASGRLGK